MSRTYRTDPETFEKRKVRENENFRRGMLFINHAPSSYRKKFNKKYKSKVKDALNKRKELPIFKKDAAYMYW